MKFLKISLLLLVPVLLLASFVVLTTGAASYRVYVIHTGSMSPHIPSGSAVLVHEGHYRVGQVITFTEDGLTVTHRLVSINSERNDHYQGRRQPDERSLARSQEPNHRRSGRGATLRGLLDHVLQEASGTGFDSARRSGSLADLGADEP